MRFLADESCDFAVVRALRREGWDVVAVSEIAPGADDQQVFDLAHGDGRTLLTEDKDFGQIFRAALHPTGSVVLIRWPASLRSTLPDAVIQVVRQLVEPLDGLLIVVQPGRSRVRRPWS